MDMKKVLSALSVLFILAACQKEVDDEVPATADGCLLVRMVQGVGNSPIGDTIFDFAYNDTGRLEQITMTSEGFSIPYDLTYDVQGRLVKVASALFPPSYLETNYTYDNEGRLHELFYQIFSDPSKIVFEYGAGTLPERALNYDNVNGQWTEMGAREYTYSNANVIKTDFYKNGVHQWSGNYEYDADLPNNTGVLPLVSYHSIPLGYYHEFLFFNKNLMTKRNWDAGSGYKIEYVQDSGRIVQSVGTAVDQGIPLQIDTRNFFFECK